MTRILLLLVLAVPLLFGQGKKQLAITIDDLPCAGGCRGLAEMQQINRRILDALRAVPAIGFVNEVGLQVDGQRDARVRLMQDWLDAGLVLGNHTYTHPDPNRTPLDRYIDDVVRGEVVTRHLLERQGYKGPLYFRHPFTHTGPDAAYKAALEKFLDSRGYTIAPFTLENADYIWALVHRRAVEKGDLATAARVRKEYIEHLGLAITAAEQISHRLFQREVPQVLLMHANLLNSEVLPDMLQLFRSRGYELVTLDKALADPAYKTPDRYVSENGPSWFDRWGIALGIPNPSVAEPDLPAWVQQAYKSLTVR